MTSLFLSSNTILSGNECNSESEGQQVFSHPVKILQDPDQQVYDTEKVHKPISTISLGNSQIRQVQES